MSLYKNTHSKLQALKAKKIDLEEFIHKLVEKNINELFQLEFIATEYYIDGYYIDTLAFDRQTDSFVIIEYKKDKNFSVVDQGMHYLSLMLGNKEKFTLELSQNRNKVLSVRNIDWSQSRVIFIAEQFTPYQIGSTGFKDFPIELWQVSQYEGELIDFQPVRAAKISTSIGQVTKSNVRKSVTSEVKEYSPEDLVKGLSPEKRTIIEIADEFILALDSRIQRKATKNYLAYQINTWNVVTIVPRWRRDAVNIDLPRVKPDHVVDPDKRVVYRDKSMERYSKDISTISVFTKADLNYALRIVKEVYDKFVEDKLS
jgi:predicted transport protein